MRTERLLLRRWQSSDLDPFAAINTDPRVTEFLPGPLTRQESDALVSRIEADFDRNGFGLWALEICGVAPLAGFVGLSMPRFTAHFTPCVEIGWRIAAEHWGLGYATEAARAALAYGFDVVGLPEIVSFAVPSNIRSRRVMEKIGMVRDAHGDFDHPSLLNGHPLQRHVLYRVGAPASEFL
jgi:RimJ/RimL family protein N-acetyltransferase